MKGTAYHKILVSKLLKHNWPNITPINARQNQENEGFSLIEVITVVLMLGILAAILAPNWFAFVNRQRLNKANDVVLAAIQEAQRQAKRNKVNYSISFKTDNNIPQLAVYQGSTPSNSDWRKLTDDLQIQSARISLGTNLSNINTISTNVAYAANFNSSSPQTISFDYMGILAAKSNGNSSDTGLRVVIAFPNQSGTVTTGSAKRCVIIDTILATTRTERDSQCN